MTETIEQPDAELAEEDLADMQSAVDAADPTEAPVGDDMRLLYRVLRIRAGIQAEHDRVKAAMAKVLGQHTRRIAALDYQFGQTLEDIAKRELSGKRAKSIKTPFGDVGFRAHAASVAIENENKLPESFFRTKTEIVIDRAKLNAHFKDTGEVPEGCQVVPGGDKFFVKT